MADSETIDKDRIEQRLLAGRSVTLFEGINAKSSQKVIEKLLLLDMEKNAPIRLYLNSPGGEVNSGFAIYDTLRFLRSEVKIICAGLCASIATIILCSVKKENRLGMNNSRFLIHQPLIGGVVRGQDTDIEITAKEIEKTKAKINRLLSEETGTALDKVCADTDRDFWMNAEESLKYGLIGRIVKHDSEV